MSRRKPPLVPVEPKSDALPVSAAKPLVLTDDERKRLLRLNRRRHALKIEAQRRAAEIDQEEMDWAESVASRLGIEPADIGTTFQVNLKTLHLEPAP